METLHTISPKQTKSLFRLRSILIVAGIVIAIICSLVSLKEIRYAEVGEGKALVSLETPTSVKVDMFVNAASTIKSLGARIY